VKDAAEEVVRITDGKGAHGIFITAERAAAYKSAQMVRVGGKVMCIGLRKFPQTTRGLYGMLMVLPANAAPNGTATVGADPAWFIFKSLHVIRTMVGSMRDTDAALGFAARVRLLH